MGDSFSKRACTREGRKREDMIMVELDSGGQMPYTPREAAHTARNFLIAQGVTLKA
jgi:hypothetical protein